MLTRGEVYIAVTTLTTVSVSLCLWQWFKNRKTYVKVGKIKKLYFYPCKSIKGIEVDELQCGSYGMEYLGMTDRSYMLISDDGQLMSQRREPRMVLLKPEITDGKLVIHDGENEPLEIPIKKGISPTDKIVTCQLHSDNVKSVDCGDEAAHWFQRFLKRTDLRLVRFSYDLPKREYTRGNNEDMKQIKKDYPVGFQDFSPFHIVLESSLEDLTSRIDVTVGVRNFRPNILISGPSAYSEDHWRYLKFSSGVEMSILFPCGRCMLTTNDPDTGIKSDKEPLTTLRKFRMAKDSTLKKNMGYSPGFGINGWLKNAGSINVGDDVSAIIEKELFQF